MMGPVFVALLALGASGAVIAVPAGVDAKLNRNLVLSDVSWLNTLDASDLLNFLPDKAMKEAINGVAIVRCHIEQAGALDACVILQETPVGLGYGKATVEAAALLRAQPGPYGSDTTVDIPIKWRFGR